MKATSTANERRQSAVRILFVSWTRHNRPRDLAERLGAEYVVPGPRALSWWWPARYVVQAVGTLVTVIRRRPAVILFTNPPFVAGAACLIGARLAGAQCWADCHSGAYNDPRWARFGVANRAVVRRCTGAIFHNADLAAREGSSVRRSVVLSVFAMRDRAVTSAPPRAAAGRAGEVVVISSYSFDEPIQAVLAAAESLPEVNFVMTGNAPPALRRSAPSNVRFPGWLDDAEYNALLGRASAAVCLTTREATMQNGIVEALENRCPVITSGTATLRAWARDVPGVLTLPGAEPEHLVDAVREILREPAVWRRYAAEGQLAALHRAETELNDLRTAITAARPS